MKRDSLWIALLILIAGWIFLKYEWLDNAFPDNEEKPAESTQRKIDSLTDQNILLGEKLEQLEAASDSLQAGINVTKTKVEQLKNQQHEKSDNMDSINGHELFDFFSKFNPENQATR